MDLSRPLSLLREEYWMVQKLSVGGFGKVYLIRHKESREYCAAKHQQLVDDSSKKISRRESAILRRLSLNGNKHILKFFEYFEGENQSVIVTEYLQGGELFKRISSKSYKLTEEKCRNFARQILRGIDFLHSYGIIHLDLKPQNIVFVTDPSTSSPSITTTTTTGSNRSDIERVEDRLKIIDFGLARNLDHPMLMIEGDRIPINMCGTLEFISPEVLRCLYAGTFSDMWSIGVIFYMMISGGYSPFRADDEYRTQRRIVRGQYTFDNPVFQSVSKSALHCISKLLCVPVEKRMTAKQCLEHEWLTGSYLDTLKVLETTWMRKYLARRRWQRWFNTIKAMNRLQNLILEDKNEEHAEWAVLESSVAEKWV